MLDGGTGPSSRTKRVRISSCDDSIGLMIFSATLRPNSELRGTEDNTHATRTDHVVEPITRHDRPASELQAEGVLHLQEYP